MMEYLGERLYIKRTADGDLELIEEQPTGLAMIRLDHARTNAIVGAMRRHWPLKPMCVLCGAIHIKIGESGDG